MALSSALTAAFLVAAFAISLWRLPPLHPVTLWCASWAGASVLFALDLLPYKPLSTTTAVLICGAAVAFAGGAIGGERAMKALAPRLGFGGAATGDDTVAIERAALSAAVIAALWLVAFLAQGIRTYSLGDTLLVSADFRTAVGSDALAVTVKYVYVATAAGVLCALAAARQSSSATSRRWLMLSAASIACIYFATSRGTIVFAAAMAAFAYWLGRGRVPSARRLLASAGLLAVLILGLMTAVGELQDKTYEDEGLSSISTSFSNRELIQPLALPYQYASASLAGFNEQVEVSTTWGDTQGCATASILCSVLRQAGLDTEPEAFSRSFIGPPVRWNIYTGLNLPLLDGGFALVLPIVALVGFAFGALWWGMRLGWTTALVLYSIAGATLLFVANYSLFVYPQGVGPSVVAVGLLLVWRLGPMLVGRLQAVRSPS